MATTFNWIYLGNTATAIDPIEGNNYAGEASALVGQIFGSSGDPLYGHVTTATMLNHGGSTTELDQNNTVSNDQFSTDIGAGTVTLTFDALAAYYGTLTYVDGTTASVRVIVAQDTAGNLFLAPPKTFDSVAVAFEAMPIQSLTLNTLDNATTDGLVIDRYVAGFDDGIIQGTSGNDLINGSYVEPVADGSDKVDNNDGLVAGDRNADSVLAGAGNDTVSSGAGADTVYGGDGRDLIYGGDGADVLHGDLGDDTIYYGLGNNLVYGGDGNDYIDDVGGAYLSTNSTLYGGAGDDTIWYGDGNSTVYGGDGNDNMDDQDGMQLAGSNCLDGGAGADTIWGGGGNDTLYGGTGSDSLSGEDGNDILAGGAGADVLSGGTGNDTLDYTASGQAVTVNLATGAVSGGDAAGDTISGFEAVSGSALGDSLTAGTGGSTLSGEAGNDTLVGGSGADVLDGGAGNDSLTGGAGNDSLTGGAEGDTLVGGSGSDLLSGGAGSDTADYSASGAGVTVDLATGTGTGGDAAGDTLSGIEAVIGTNYADHLNGDAGANWLSGGGGGDHFLGGAGADSLYGGSGSDLADYSTSGAGVSVDLTTGIGLGGDAEGDVLSEIENVTGSEFDDTLTGSAGNNQLTGAAGNDLLTGSTGNDTLFGGADADSLLGNAGNDSLSGGDGNDRLTGGTGSDTLTGGLGRDSHELVLGGGADRITDFSMTPVGSQTEDQLDVSDLVNLDGSPVKAFDVAVGDDGTGNALLTFPGGETLVLAGVSPTTVAQPGMLFAMGVPCFAAGTRIATPGGERRVEEIAPGETVLTADGQVLPVLWHGRRHLGAEDLAARLELRPVQIRPGAFGNGRALVLSPQHALAIAGPEGPRLVRARHLAWLGRGARVMRGARGVSYHHLLLPRHALVLAEGCAAESFYPGPQALAGLPRPDVQRLVQALGLPPGLAAQPQRIAAAYGPRCLPLASRSELRRDPMPPAAETAEPLRA